ncbi:helix-turn-helix domain-containing protein [Streptomyces sp. G45]|uniref:nSTAND1 domain-containing NTPase n=1 Tax=Streptomyces sp. G45 TaxID=3406627 RepID=UPI003C1E9B57
MERFAWELRQLRERAGGPSYRALARRAHYAASTLADAAKGRRLPSLEVALAYARACGAEPQEWETRWRAAEAAALAAEREREEARSQGPYPGLAAYGAEDAPYFFGRSDLLKELVDLVAREALTAVSGVSGSGKSSLLRAGLLPALEPHCHPVVFTPGARPLRALAGAAVDLAAGAGGTDGTDGTDDAREDRRGAAARLAGQLAEDASALALALTTALAGRADDTRFVMVVDQLEEVFTLCEDAAERAAFLAAVAHLVRACPQQVRVVLGVRADFYAHCFAHPGLVAALRSGGQLPVGPPTRAELRDILVEPAARCGVAVAADLQEAVLADAADQPGALPLVAHVMREVWRARGGPLLRLADYRACGGVRGAVARSAEQAYTRATAAQQESIRALFLRLTVPGDGTEATRRRVPLEELDGLGLGAMVGDLVAARLLVTSGRTVEVAHEAVVRAWPRLRRWLDEDQDALRAHRALTTAARTWDELGRDDGALYRGAQLAVAREWAAGHPHALNTREAAFLRASTAASRRRTRRGRQLMAALGVLVVLALTATGVAVHKSSTAEAQRRLATSRELAARAAQLSERRPEAAMVLALRGYRQARTAEARGSLLSAYARYHANQLTGHTRAVQSAAFAPDGRTLATASFDHTVKLWDARTRRLRATLTGHTDAVNAVAFAPDGRTLATAGNDRGVKLWDARSHRLLATLTGHTNMVEAVAFSPDGRTLASTGSDRTVRLWSVRGHRERAVLTGHTEAVLRLAFSPDGRTLASAGSDHSTRLWDVASRTSRAVLSGRTGAIGSVAFSPDGRTLATSSTDHGVALWDTRSRRLRATLSGHTKTVQEVAFSPDGRTLASTGLDGTVRLWRPSARTPLTATLRVGGPGYALSFSPDGRTLATTGKGSAVQLWNVASHRPLAALTGRSGVVTTRVPYATSGAALTVDHPGHTARWAPTPPSAHAVPSSAGRHVTASAASDDGRAVALAGADRTVRVFDAATGRRTATLRGASSGVRQLVLSADGRHLAAHSGDGTIRLWQVATGRVTVVRGDRATLNLALAADGRTLAAVATDGTTRVWRVRPGRAARPLPGPRNATMALDFSPDGRTLAFGSADNSLRLWDVGAHRATATLTGHTGYVIGASYNPDGSLLATTGSDGGVRLWSTGRAPRLLAALDGPVSPQPTPRFSPDGRAFVAFDTRADARVWNTDADDVAARVCRIATSQNWERLFPDQTVTDVC